MISSRPIKAAEPQLDPHYLENLQTYERLKSKIDGSYPRGWFIGINDGRIISVAATIDELIAAIEAMGQNPRDALAVRAGDRYPDYRVIF
jgi:hypothetical protein